MKVDWIASFDSFGAGLRRFDIKGPVRIKWMRA